MHNFTDQIAVRVESRSSDAQSRSLHLFLKQEYLAATWMFFFFLVVSCPIVKDQLCSDPQATDLLHMSLILEVGLRAAFKNNDCETFVIYTSVSKQKRVGSQDMSYISSQHQGKGGKKNLC